MKKIFHLSGLHCASCELLVESSVKENIADAEVNVSHRRGTLKIEAPVINDNRVKKIVEQCGYKVLSDSEQVAAKKSAKKNWWQILAVFAGVFLMAWLISRLDLARFFPDLSREVSFALAFFVGIVASLSTCLAITGGLVISLSAGIKTNKGDKPSLLDRSRPQLYFQIGRIGGFFLLGGLLGALGNGLQYSTSVSSFLMILVALIMVYVGLNIIGLAPSLSKLGVFLPKKWSHKILDTKVGNKPLLIILLGALTFFLPCGFTQSMQLAAIASGNFWSGALIMAFFALGTSPVLFSVGLGANYAQGNHFGLVKKIIASVIIIFGLYSLNAGLILSGVSFSPKLLNAKTEFNQEEPKETVPDFQTVQLDINNGFVQKEFRIKKDVPVKFVVNAIRVNGCSDEVIIRRLNLTTGKLKNGDRAVLEFTPTKTGVIPFSCWMGMINGRFIVEE